MFELIDVWKGPERAVSASDWVLAGANLTIPAGRKIALLGLDSEKISTVLRILSGVDDADKGAVRRVGVPCWPLDYGGFADNNATVRQNANFLGRVYGVDGGEIARIAGLLSGVRLIKGRTMRQYRGPDRRALQLGLTLAFQFDWYFIDGRLPKLPEETEAAMQAAMSDRISRASLIWATSNIKLVSDYCDAGLILDQGLLTFYDDFAEAAAAFDILTTSQAKASDEDDGHSGGKKRDRRAARRARQNGAEEPV